MSQSLHTFVTNSTKRHEFVVLEKIVCCSINSEEKYFCAQTYTCYLVPVNACHLLLATV